MTNTAKAPSEKVPRRAPQPRDAATVVIVRRDRGEAEILMGRRNRGHSFMPSKWVFPGGRIARQDFSAPAATELNAEVADRIADGLDGARARAIAIAGIRETFEETGLLLAAPISSPPRRGAWQSFCAGGVAPDLAGLIYFARLITPPQRDKRFDTRFFRADAERLVSLDPVDSKELEDVAWFSIDRCRSLELPFATRLILSELEASFAGEERPFMFHRFRNIRK